MNRLVKVVASSIYFKDYNSNGRFDPAQDTLYKLPDRIAWCTESMASKLQKTCTGMTAQGFGFTISDLFRSEQMQLQAHLDYILGQCYSGGKCISESNAAQIREDAKTAGVVLAPMGKKAFSPPPKSSFHEVGCAVDVNMVWNSITGLNFSDKDKIAIRKIILESGLTSIAQLGQSEEWHYEDRDLYRDVYDAAYKEAFTKQSYNQAVKIAYKAYIAAAFADLELPPYTDGKYKTIVIQ